MGHAVAKFTFKYGHWKRATVTVYAKSIEQALDRAHTEMDRRYELRGDEPPVAWTLRPIGLRRPAKGE